MKENLFAKKYFAKLSKNYLSEKIIDSFKNANSSYSRRRGVQNIKQFTYIDENGSFLLNNLVINNDSDTWIDSPFGKLNNNLNDLVSSKLLNSNDITNNNSYFDIYDLLEIERTIRSLIRILDDRSNNLLNSRDSDHFICSNCLIIIKELTHLTSVLHHVQEIISKASNIKFDTSFHKIISLIEFTINIYFPKLDLKIYSIINEIFNKISCEKLLKYFQKNNLNEFVSYWGSKSEIYKNESESYIVNLMVNDSISQKILEFIKILNFKYVDISKLLTTWVNVVLDSLFRCILESGCLFDEFGVYKLFRIVLKYQDFVIGLKKKMNIPVGSVLILDSSSWSNAEHIIQLLNNAIFDKRKSSSCFQTNVTNNNNNNNNNHESIERTSPLSVDIREKWILLVHSKQRNPFSCVKRRKLRGTVSVSLQIPLNGL